MTQNRRHFLSSITISASWTESRRSERQTGSSMTLCSSDLINHYIRFVDREPEKRKTDWKLNDRWVWFIGKDRPPIKLTTDPEPYTLERTLGWISRQVAPTLKMLKKIDAGNSTSYLKEIEDNAKLTEKHLQIIRQQTADTEELITE